MYTHIIIRYNLGQYDLIDLKPGADGQICFFFQEIHLQHYYQFTKSSRLSKNDNQHVEIELNI